MSLPFNQILKTHKIVWRLCGAWFSENSYPRLYKTFSGLLHLLHLTFCISQWLYLKEVHGLMKANDIATVSSIFTLVSVKSILFIRRKEKCVDILELLLDMEKDIDNESAAEQAIVQKTLEQMRFIGKLIAICASSAAFVQLFLTQVLSKDRLLVFPAIMPVDWQHDNFALYATNVFQMVCALYSSAILATLDIIGPHLYMMLDAYVQILHHRLKSIGWTSSKSTKVTLKNYDLQIVSCIKFHEQCLR